MWDGRVIGEGNENSQSPWIPPTTEGEGHSWWGTVRRYGGHSALDQRVVLEGRVRAELRWTGCAGGQMSHLTIPPLCRHRALVAHAVEKQGDTLGERQGCHEPVDLKDTVSARRGWGGRAPLRSQGEALRGGAGRVGRVGRRFTYSCRAQTPRRCQQPGSRQTSSGRA